MRSAVTALYGVAPVSAEPDNADLPDANDVRWLRRYQQGLFVGDLGALLLASLVALVFRFGTAGGQQLRGVSYLLIAFLMTVGWVAVLALSRCYEARFLGSGAEEFRRVFNASVRFTALLGLTAFVFQLEIARGFVGVLIPLGIALVLLGRLAARTGLHRRRRQGRCGHRVVVVGSYVDVQDLTRQLRREPLAGLNVVGACVPGDSRKVVRMGDGPAVPVLGSFSNVHDALLAAKADTLAVAASRGLQGEALRRLSYELEGSGVDLLVAPALTNVTGTRITIRPVAGLPLLHLDEPELSGVRTVVKAVFDRSLALVGLLLSAPLLLAIAIGVRLSSPGPALFSQTRVGRDGKTFPVYKFRSMYVDAEARLYDLMAHNEHDGVLFKMRVDPRVTPFGRFLRSWSFDELPQLVNVLLGHMSLVGPRPPLPSEVERYVGHTRRRLLVKPGITGLWQVSGRSTLSWEETVRLDLQYVENWSLGLDLTVLAKTVVTVLRRQGAY